MSILVELDQDVKYNLAVGIKAILVRAIGGAVAFGSWSIRVLYPSASGTLMVSLAAPDGIPARRLSYSQEQIPSEEELMEAFDHSRYDVPWHPFFIQLEYDLFREIIRYFARTASQDPSALTSMLRGIGAMEHEIDHAGDLPVSISEDMPNRATDAGENNDTLELSFWVEPQVPDDTTEWVTLPIFYWTNRGIFEQTSPGANISYTARRGAVPSMGVCEVSLPRKHQLGDVERPKWHFFPEHPDRHVMLRSVRALDEDEFRSQIGKDLAQYPKVLVYVHGYNCTFERAARQAGQIKCDLGFNGPVVMFSWASLGRRWGYLADEAIVEWSVPHCEQLIKVLCSLAPANGLHVIAHSMGNRIVIRSIEKHAATSPPVGIGRVFLAAPDMDADTLNQSVAGVRAGSDRVTLYGSDNDRAMVFSRVLHAAPRAGEGGDRLLLHPAIDSIDASNADTASGGHSYVTDSAAVLSDMHQVITTGHDPSLRFGLKRRNRGGWQFEQRRF